MFILRSFSYQTVWSITGAVGNAGASVLHDKQSGQSPELLVGLVQSVLSWQTAWPITGDFGSDGARRPPGRHSGRSSELLVSQQEIP